MGKHFCPNRSKWMPELSRPGHLTVPSPEVCEHITTCVQCRGTLILLMSELLAAPFDSIHTSCTQCQEDLAAFIDIERQEDMETALRVYPHVWWHLWTCVDCAETYHLTIAIQNAEESRQLPPLPLASLVNRSPVPHLRPFIGNLTLPRAWFVQVFKPQYGIAWGNDEDDTVIHEEEDSNYQIRVSVRKQGSEWMIVLTIDPPLVGDAIVTLGSTVFRTPIDPDGIATLGPISPDLLQNPIGPDLSIQAELTLP